MGRSRHLNVDCARSQEAYFAKIRTAVQAWVKGDQHVACPRDGCQQLLKATSYGHSIVLQCPKCGLLYRGSRDRLLEFWD